jgi:hypothetical protein
MKMIADKYLASLKQINLTLLLLLFTAWTLFFTEMFNANRIHNGLIMLFVQDIYKSLPLLHFDHHPTNRYLISEIYIHSIASNQENDYFTLEKHGPIAVPEQEYDHEATAIFDLGEITSRGATTGYCNVIALSAASAAPHIFAKLQNIKTLSVDEIKKEDVFLLNFSIGCNHSATSLLLLKVEASPSGWLIAAPLKTKDMLDVLLLSNHNLYLAKDIKIEKQWFVSAATYFYRDQISVANDYLIIEDEIAHEALLYYASLISGVMRETDEVRKASEDILISHGAKATLGSLTTGFDIYVIVLPLIVTVLVYIGKTRIEALEKAAEDVGEPWTLKDAEKYLDRFVGILLCFWPLLATALSYGMYSYLFGRELNLAGWTINPWGMLRWVDILREPAMSLAVWEEWGERYSRFLLGTFILTLLSSMKYLRSGLRIMRTYRTLRGDPMRSYYD